MRITIVSAGDVTRDPAAPPLLHTLCAAGHDVSVVASRAGTVGGIEVTPPSDAHSKRLFRGGDPADPATKLGRAISRTKPDIIQPLRHRDLPAALAAKRGLVARAPGWEIHPGRDLIEQAPHRPAVSQPIATTELTLFHPGSRHRASSSAAGRHRGRRLALVYRHSGTSPGRYLATAAERAGIDVQRFDGELDWEEVHPGTAAVVFVESPYPAAQIHGVNPGIPVLFWVHHGEHHLAANLRLIDRYGVDAVLLAHSWHLAYRFPVAVHRFPFAVAPELFAEEPPSFAARTVDVAMVGAGVERESPRYRERFIRVQDLRSEFPGRALFRSDLEPEAMAAIYSNARVVINDGGARHHPITMRVFEAIGAGALLATEHAPGLDLLFKPGTHYDELSWTVPAHIRDLVNDPKTGHRALAAHDHAMARHTYDHRIDDLLEVAADTKHEPRSSDAKAKAIDRVIDADVEVSTVAVFGDVAVTLPDREIRNGLPWLEANRDGRFDAAVLAQGAAEPALLAPAVRRYMYVVGGNVDKLLAEVCRGRPKATAETIDGIVRIDMGAPGYQIRPAP